MIMSIFGLSRINKRCHEINYESAQELLDNYFKKYKIALNIQGIQNIPTSGRFILIANHPYGFLDGLNHSNISKSEDYSQFFTA